MKNNVIGMNSAKNELKVKKAETEFKNYLKTLKQEELQSEANYILNTMGDDLSIEDLNKSALLMEELAKRVSNNNMSSSINDLAETLRKQLDKKSIKLH